MTGGPPGTLRLRIEGLLARRAPLIAGLVALVVGVGTISSDPIGVYNDDGLYLLTARALAEGLGFVYPQLPGTPPAIHYPPVFPLLLAVVWKVAPAFPDSAIWFKLLNPVFAACAAAGAVVTGRRLFGLPSWAALLAAIVGTASIPFLLLTMFVLSEPLFLALLFPTLWMADRLVNEDTGPGRTVASAALCALLVLTRTIGGVVFVATLMLLVGRRRWRTATVYAVTVVTLLMPWQLFVWNAAEDFPDELRGSYGPYLEWVADGYRSEGLPLFTATVAQNLRSLRTFGATMALPVPALNPVQAGVGVVVLGLGLAGGVLLWMRRRSRVTLLAMAGYLAVAISWPFTIDRFVWAVWPLLVILVAAGIREVLLLTADRPRALRVAFISSVVIVAVLHEHFTVKSLLGGWRRDMSREMMGYGVSLARAVNLEPRLKGLRMVTELAPLVALYGGDTVIPAEILTARQHLHRKTIAEHQAEIEAIDARFLPKAFVLLRGSPYDRALRQARLGPGRTLTDIAAPTAPVRIILVDDR